MRYDSPYGARELVPPRFLNRHFYDHTRTHEHVDCSYFAQCGEGEARHEVEGGEIRWFSKDDIERTEYDIVPDVRAHARAALSEVL